MVGFELHLSLKLSIMQLMGGIEIFAKHENAMNTHMKCEEIINIYMLPNFNCHIDSISNQLEDNHLFMSKKKFLEEFN